MCLIRRLDYSNQSGWPEQRLIISVQKDGIDQSDWSLFSHSDPKNWSHTLISPSQLSSGLDQSKWSEHSEWSDHVRTVADHICTYIDQSDNRIWSCQWLIRSDQNRVTDQEQMRVTGQRERVTELIKPDQLSDWLLTYQVGVTSDLINARCLIR